MFTQFYIDRISFSFDEKLTRLWAYVCNYSTQISWKEQTKGEGRKFNSPYESTPAIIIILKDFRAENFWMKMISG